MKSILKSCRLLQGVQLEHPAGPTRSCSKAVPRANFFLLRDLHATMETCPCTACFILKHQGHWPLKHIFDCQLMKYYRPRDITGVPSIQPQAGGAIDATWR